MWLEKRRSETGMCSVRASNEDLKKERTKERHEGRKKEKYSKKEENEFATA